MDTNNRQQTLTDIFLEVLSEKSNPDMQDAIARIKVTLKIPECAELFNVVLINALGYKSNISRNTVECAIDCVINKNKLEIDKTDQNEAEKERQKKNCESLCHSVRIWILNRLKGSGQLIE